MLSRRQFLAASASGVWALRGLGATPAGGRFGDDAAALLTGWCDGLLRLQLPEGAFRCPACRLIHGRCADASYPLLHLAARTGERKYLEAALRVRDWSRNVACGRLRTKLLALHQRIERPA